MLNDNSIMMGCADMQINLVNVCLVFRSVMLRSIAVVFCLVVCLPNYSLGETTLGSHTYGVTVVVPPKIAVNQAQLTLGNIATITQINGHHGGQTKSGDYAENGDDVKKLSAVIIGEAPTPKNTLVISGAKILEAIKSAGISLDAFGYSIPQEILIERMGHVLELEEVKEAVRAYFASENEFDLTLRDVQVAKAYVVPAGPADINVTRLGEPVGGKVPLRVEVSIEDKIEANFTATAIVDDWRDVPVATRVIERGRLIRPEDMQLVRLNMFNQPVDALSDAKEVVGLRAKTNISAGEMVRRAVVDIPPTIERGKRVTLLYRVPGFEVSATGVAVEDGFKSQSIRVKNIKSQKIVTANVISEDMAEVVSE